MTDPAARGVYGRLLRCWKAAPAKSRIASLHAQAACPCSAYLWNGAGMPCPCAAGAPPAAPHRARRSLLRSITASGYTFHENQSPPAAPYRRPSVDGRGPSRPLRPVSDFITAAMQDFITAARHDDINTMPFTTLLSAQITEW